MNCPDLYFAPNLYTYVRMCLWFVPVMGWVELGFKPSVSMYVGTYSAMG